MAPIPKTTAEGNFGSFLTGVLNGYVEGRGLEMTRAKEQRSNESALIEQRLNTLQIQIAEANLREQEATQGLQRRLTESEINKNNATSSDEVLRLKADTARANADRAQAMADKAKAEADLENEKNNLQRIINQIQGFKGADSFQGQSFQVEGDEAGDFDTRDVPAGEEPGVSPVSPGLFPGGPTPPGVALGGRRVLTGPPREGNIMEEEDTNAMMAPGDVARSFLPPGAPAPKKPPRILPVQRAEIDAALKAPDVDAAFRQLISNEGQPFGAEAEKKKREKPLEYAQDMDKEIERHAKQYPGPYQRYREMGGKQSKLKSRMLEILTDPSERAWQTTRDTDAAASQAVSEFSLAELLKDNPNNPLSQYLSMDRAQGGNVARYSGRLLNLAMQDVFGAGAQNLAFSDDLDYTLAQIVEALYSDSMAANGKAQLGFTNGLSTAGASNIDHQIMRILDAYWEPVRAMDRRTAEKKYQQKHPVNALYRYGR